MPIYTLDVEKQLGDEYWTNTYYINAPDLNAAALVRNEIVTWERAHHLTRVVLTKSRLRPANMPGAQGVTAEIGQNGQGGGAGANTLPLFCVIRMDLRPSLGRPSRKYYRFPVPVSVQTDGVLVPADRASYQAVANALADIAGLCDPQGQTFNDAYVPAQVAMRQLRRGSRRKLPVLP